MEQNLSKETISTNNYRKLLSEIYRFALETVEYMDDDEITCKFEHFKKEYGLSIEKSIRSGDDD